MPANKLDSKHISQKMCRDFINLFYFSSALLCRNSVTLRLPMTFAINKKIQKYVTKYTMFLNIFPSNYNIVTEIQQT